MKKWLLCWMLLLSCFPVFAQNPRVIEKLYIRDSLGIGVAVPDYELHVQGADETYIKIETTGTDSDGGLRIANDAQEYRLYIRGGASDKLSIHDVTGGGVPFEIEAGTPTDTLYLDSAGYVGIKTTGPDRLLDILSTTNPQIRLTEVDGTDYTDIQGIVDNESGTDYSKLRVTGSDAPMIVSKNSSGNAYLRIDSGSSATSSVQYHANGSSIWRWEKDSSNNMNLARSGVSTPFVAAAAGNSITLTGTTVSADLSVNGNTNAGNGQGDIFTATGHAIIDTGPTENTAALELKQDDPSDPFEKYTGTSSTGTGQHLTTWTTGATIAGFRQINVNGTTYWEPFYTAPTGP